MTARQAATFLGAYSRSFTAPVQAHTRVERLQIRDDNRFEVATSDSVWQARNVIVATGWSDKPAVPPLAADLHPSIDQLAPASYRNPGQLADGGVLVVGASASGVQLAHELRLDGRPVYLAVSRHTRMLRRYRGRDIFWWLERIGALDRRIDQMPSPADAPHEPSMQLIGRPDSTNVDLATLAASGVVLFGRLTTLDGAVAQFGNDLDAQMAKADERLCRLLGRIDRYIADNHLPERAFPLERPIRLRPVDPVHRVDLRQAGITTVIWATGHRRDNRWLPASVVGADGELAQRYGITPIPGLYALGQRFQRTRRSNFLDGVGADALAITNHLLDRQRHRD
jgi:putative flavoprotein involved in K+ transport